MSTKSVIKIFLLSKRFIYPQTPIARQDVPSALCDHLLPTACLLLASWGKAKLNVRKTGVLIASLFSNYQPASGIYIDDINTTWGIVMKCEYARSIDKNYA